MNKLLLLLLPVIAIVMLLGVVSWQYWVEEPSSQRGGEINDTANETAIVAVTVSTPTLVPTTIPTPQVTARDFKKITSRPDPLKTYTGYSPKAIVNHTIVNVTVSTPPTTIPTLAPETTATPTPTISCGKGQGIT